METHSLREKILETIIRKSTLKQKVFDNTFAAFNLLKETLLEMASEMDDALDGKLDRRVRLEYRDRGKFEAQLQASFRRAGFLSILAAASAAAAAFVLYPIFFIRTSV